MTQTAVNYSLLSKACVHNLNCRLNIFNRCFHSKRFKKIKYLFRGANCLTVSGEVADLKVGEPAKPLINAGLGNWVTWRKKIRQEIFLIKTFYSTDKLCRNKANTDISQTLHVPYEQATNQCRVQVALSSWPALRGHQPVKRKLLLCSIHRWDVVGGVALLDIRGHVHWPKPILWHKGVDGNGLGLYSCLEFMWMCKCVNNHNCNNCV